MMAPIHLLCQVVLVFLRKVGPTHQLEEIDPDGLTGRDVEGSKG